MARINSGTMTVVIFAMLVGLGGAFVVRQQLKQIPLVALPEPEPIIPNVVVPTAAMDLVPGQVLTINEIALVSLSPERFDATPYAKQAFMRNPEQINGRAIKRALKKGEAFLPEDFYPGQGGPGIAERLKPGMRGVTISIENVGAVHGFAGPGSVVDVLFRSRPEGDRPEVTLTLIERVEVLALSTNVVPGQQVEIDQDGTVTLSVTPQQAKILKVVEGRGELSLTLRSEEDIELLPFELDSMQPFLSDDQPEVPANLTGLTSSTSTNLDQKSATLESRLTAKNVERITLDDLLGAPAVTPSRQMEIYLGPEKTVVEFGKAPDITYQLLQNGGKIRTPIAQDPSKSSPDLTMETKVKRVIPGRTMVSISR